MSDSKDFEDVGGTREARETLKSRSVRGIAFVAIGSGGEFVVRLASIAILAHLIVPEHFGLIGMITAVTTIFAGIVHLGLGLATVQRPEITHGEVSSLFWINVVFGGVLAVGLCLGAPLLARFYGDDRLIGITYVTASVFLFAGLAVQHEALLNRQMRQNQTAVVRFMAGFLSAVLAVALAVAGFGYWALAWQEASRAMFSVIGFWLFSRWIPGRPIPVGRLKPLLSFGWHMTLIDLLNGVVTNLDRILLGRFFGAVPLGLYGRAQQLVTASVQQLNVPIQSIAQPALCLLQKEEVRFQRYFQKFVFAIGLATMPVATLGAIYAGEIALVVLGPNWTQAAILIRVFAVWAFIRPVLGVAGVVLIALGQSQRLLRFSYVRNVVFVGMTLVGLRWGIEGVAIAQASSTYLLLMPSLLYSFAKAPVSVGLFFRAIRAPMLASGLMTAGLLTFHQIVTGLSPIVSLVVGGLLGAPLYLVGLCLLPGDRSDTLEIVDEVLERIRGTKRFTSA